MEKKQPREKWQGQEGEKRFKVRDDDIEGALGDAINMQLAPTMGHKSMSLSHTHTHTRFHTGNISLR